MDLPNDGLALVTGAGDGIGEMMAKKIAGLGWRVAVQDIRKEAAERVAKEIGPRAFPLVFDVSDREASFEAAEQLKAGHGTLNMLWINAGVGVGAPIIGGGERLVEWAYSVNAMGVIWTAQAFAPLLQGATGFRHIGITASSSSLRSPEGNFPLYATTKHATFAIAEALRAEMARDDIPTTILCPGLLNSNIWDGAKARPDRFGGPSYMDPKIATMWREAKSPELMWPHIEAKLKTGGGYLVCLTDDGETAEHWQARLKDIQAGFVEI